MLAIITMNKIISINAPNVTVIYDEVHRITRLTFVEFFQSLESSIQKDFLHLCSAIGLISAKVLLILMAYFSNYYTIRVHNSMSIVLRVLWTPWINFKNVYMWIFFLKRSNRRENSQKDQLPQKKACAISNSEKLIEIWESSRINC